MTQKTFLLGMGAQKAGTSWLHDYLSRHPQCDTGFTKEYHILDAIHVPEFAHFRARQEARAESRPGPRKNGMPRPNAARAAFCSDITTYFDYFAGLLGGSGGTRLAADITPTYLSLPAAALTEARDQMARRGVVTKPVLLMRDPVERIWSAVRMSRRNSAEADPEWSPSKSESEAVRKVHRQPRYELRTRYEHAIRNMDACFAPGDAVYGFYEAMFTEDWVRTFCAVMGIDYAAPDFDLRINTTERKEALEEEVIAEVVRYYRDTYSFVAGRFGRDLVARLWPNIRYLDQ